LALACDQLIAVAAPTVAAALARVDQVDAVAYPAHVFFGSLVHGRVFPAIRSSRGLRIRCETALASGVMELVLAELGVGWLPRRLAAQNIRNGSLIDVTPVLGGVALDIVATRNPENTNPLMTEAWRALGAIHARA
jgi:DNA-binding transcriptional LysR family regulator